MPQGSRLKPVNKIASMAAKHFYRQGLLLLLFNFISTAALEKRFSDFKRCADEECSMLLCRGKAVKDFTGPDCRFLSVRKSETIYVYYKLSGRRRDLWAGSVGSNFGYFPKDFIAVNHNYTNKELEIPAEETDFVCFDTGFDKFDNYDVDSLLGSSQGENDSENKGASDRSPVAEDTQKGTEPSADSEEQSEHHDNTEDLDGVPDYLSASSPELEPVVICDSTDSCAGTEATFEATERETEDTDVQKNTAGSVLENIALRRRETKDAPAEPDEGSGEEVYVAESESPSEGPYDAVATDEDIAGNVTPYEEEEEEEDEYVQSPPDDDDVEVETPLPSFSEERANAPASDYRQQRQSPPTTNGGEAETAEEEKKNVWNSIGDAVFSVLSGGEVTEAHDSSSEEGEDDDVEEEEDEAALKTSQSFEEADIEEPTSEEQESAELDLQDPVSSSEPTENKEPNSDYDDDGDDDDDDDDDDESDGDVVRPEEAWEEIPSVDQASRDDPSAAPEAQKSHHAADEPVEHKEEEEEELSDAEADGGTAAPRESGIATERTGDLANEPLDSETVRDEDLVGAEAESHQDLSDVEDEEKSVDDRAPNQMRDSLMTDSDVTNGRTEFSPEEPEVVEELLPAELEDEKDTEMEKEEELLVDENASWSNGADEPSPETTTPEPDYSDSVLRMTLLRDHLTEVSMERLQKRLGLKNLFKVEAMFSDLDTELRATRRTHKGATQDIESALEAILEASENAILDEIEKMLDSQGRKRSYDEHVDTSALDEETEILDDLQELAFSLRQKHSTASDSAPLATESESDVDHDEHQLGIDDDTPHIVDENNADGVPEEESDDNLTATGHAERPAEDKEESMVLDEAPDVGVEEDGGHFNKNKDDQLSFGAAEEVPKVPQATLQNPLDVGLGVEVEHSSSGSLESVEPVSEVHEEEVGLFSTGIVYVGCILSMAKSKIAEWTPVMIALLPDEWKPGETLYGCPWQAVVATALVGVVTFILFIWRTVLAVRRREYIVDEKRLTEHIQALKEEKNDALAKMSALEKKTEQLKEYQKQSKEKVSSSMKRIRDLESKVSEAQTLNDNMAEEKSKYAKLLEEERESSLKNEKRIEKLEKTNEKLQLGRKKIQEALAKTTVLLDESKIREDARRAQHKCLEKDHGALKEENKKLKVAIKDWEDKHKELNEKIKVYQKSQRELEDSVVLKDHNVEVLSDLLADLDACDSQKGALANSEVAPDKKTAIKNRIKQMMDVSRVQTTLAVVEEERDRFMTKLLNEEKVRRSLEEQHQELEHSIAAIKSEKSHVENQFKTLQQKNEIMVEMYQQKENALQQRLTKEELERRSKENLLSEVGGKALEAEEQVKVLRQRINEMDEQMKKTEDVYKEQIKEQENKTHSNWVNARNAERALSQEKLESSKLREKLAVLTSQLNERRAPLFTPNSGHPAGPRQGDSYGPSPVSGGAPSPPPMIEGPRRPPSAPVGRRIDPYGPRPPSDPHGRYLENKHISGMDVTGPRSSSPATMDGSTPGSFLASPIRDSPGPMVPGPPPPGPGPHDQLPPPGRLPPGPYRPPRPGIYNLPPGAHGPPLPANGHPAMGDFGPRPTNGHAFFPRPGPGHGVDLRGPPPPPFRPFPPPFGPMHPPPGVRGPMGPRPPVPPDMRFPGPRDHPSLSANLPPGVPPPAAAHGEVYSQAPPTAHQNSAVDHGGPGQGPQGKRGAPQDSGRPAMAKP